MARTAIIVLRIVIALSLVGSLLTQTLIMWALWQDLVGVEMGTRIAIVALGVLWIACLQTTAVCIWQLLTMVAAGSVFSDRAFRYVNIVIGAVLAAAALTAVLATMLVPGEAAPGVVGLIYGAALVTAGVALVIVVMRMLLRQASDMRAELAEVV
ncbi:MULTISPECIES: DUF2975 domain-containing protein [unclassified Microbacterium]|uniref:DUF2975 domain-containing protein n=1 Tax=unclassified Microbacterium TaxID=2609290 RepID=UPI00386772E4